MPADDIRGLLVQAKSYQTTLGANERAEPVLAGCSVANLFFEDSTRTRSSFTAAAQALGATTVDLFGPGSSMSKGETLADTAMNIEALGVAAIVVRARQSGAAENMARAVRCPIVNAGDGRHEHPTQALLDALALANALRRDEGFSFEGVTVAIVGDVASSRVARSNAACLTALGARVVLVGPPAFAPFSLTVLGATSAGSGPCEVSGDLDAVLGEADAVMALRIQFERHGGGPTISSAREFRQLFGLTAARAARMKPGAFVMHPGPMNRGLEIDGVVADDHHAPLARGGGRSRQGRSLIMHQVRCGVAVRMAALAACCGG